MGIRSAVLIFLLLFPALAGAAELCTQCHVSHYPALGCTSCHRGNPLTGRKNIAHDGLLYRFDAAFLMETPTTARGRDSIQLFGCRRCHRIGASGGSTATSLNSALRKLGSDALRKKIETPAYAMPDFQISGVELDTLIAALYRETVTSPPEKNNGKTVYFRTAGKAAADRFVRSCGGCHRMLTQKYGALGAGNAAPDLSGILGAEYPPALPGKRWTPDLLEKWVTNPRSVRKEALMPPQPKEAKETVRFMIDALR